MEREKLKELIPVEWHKKEMETTEKVEETVRKPSSRIIGMSESKGIPGLTITVGEAQKKYGLSAYKINKIAQERDADIYIGSQKYILEARIEEYIHEQNNRKRLKKM